MAHTTYMAQYLAHIDILGTIYGTYHIYGTIYGFMLITHVRPQSLLPSNTWRNEMVERDATCLQGRKELEQSSWWHTFTNHQDCFPVVKHCIKVTFQHWDFLAALANWLEPRGERERLFGSREREGKLKITLPFYGKGTGIRKLLREGRGREIWGL